ncbi:MAG: tRNA uridine-5-carboxymethylaminomethyl(34) synthesis GTPase MnmE [Planctomycetaceae bacterium]|nr:tRNA uridine-5-carboxymethylaminomethyl(34) synthesis GTPase MnmE [Planctomycetaceae bacterium]
MYDINDTIIAVSSGATPSIKKIIRVSGDKTFDLLKSLAGCDLRKQKTITPVHIDFDGLGVECLIYSFVSPHSYTGEDTAEIHICGCDEIIEKLFAKFLASGCRAALAGEFTYRAYVNGKIDLSRAEAIAEIIESSNQYQLAAAQKLFGGSIEKKVSQIRKDILELLSLIEAGLDFSADDIEIISKDKAKESAEKILTDLNELLGGSITFEQISQAPTVVIAGAANAGKSSLVNALLGENRSIVSDQSGTTRDVLEHWLELDKCDCVLVDCAGVITKSDDTLQNLANEAAKRAVQNSDVLIFCVDSSKEEYAEDLEIIKNIVCRGEPTCSPTGQAHRSAPTIFLATKCDLPSNQNKLETIFKQKFLQTSVKNKTGLDELKNAIEQNIISQTAASSESHDKTALTQRHKAAVSDAVKNIENAITEIQNGNEEIAAAVLRAALQNLSKLETEHIDEAILDNIFSRFCIGK